MIVSPGKIKTNVSVNAIGAEGKSHNQMDPSHENAMSAEKCARVITNALAAKRKEVLIGGKELLMVKLKKYVPSLFERLIRKQSPF